MIGVFIVPTGVGAEIGGHAGDATPALKLVAACCDEVITHPNVVNASDINEMTENTLYVEGSILDRFLKGEIGLKKIKKNKILLATNSPIKVETINAVSASRVTLGIDIEIMVLNKPLKMTASMNNNGTASGEVIGHEELISQVKCHELFNNIDALAIHTPINVPREVALQYYRNGGVNPWGGVEAKASKLIAGGLDMPVAHAPVEETSPEDEELFLIFQDEAVDPRIAPEAISNCYLHCVLKGLHKAPRITRPNKRNSIMVEDVDFMVSPYGCWSDPHISCHKNGIPTIFVKENKTCISMNMGASDLVIYAENYLDAIGHIMAIKGGVDPCLVRRPVKETTILFTEEGLCDE